jgi:hypothetical protein
VAMTGAGKVPPGDRARHSGGALVARPVQPPGQEPSQPDGTVARFTPSRAATAVLLPPSAQASTIRARSANPCTALLRRNQLSKVRRSSSDGADDANLESGILQAHGITTDLSPPSECPQERRASVGLGPASAALDRASVSGSPILPRIVRA